MTTTPDVPETPRATGIPLDQPAPAPAKRSWRRLPRGRTAIVAGAVAAALVVGGAGFGAGYAVGDSGQSDLAQQTSLDGDRGFPDGDHGFPDGDRAGLPPGGQLGGLPGDQGGGTTGEAPDFDGDGQPDTDSGSGTTSQS